jgi:hypothetical protein
MGMGSVGNCVSREWSSWDWVHLGKVQLRMESLGNSADGNWSRWERLTWELRHWVLIGIGPVGNGVTWELVQMGKVHFELRHWVLMGIGPVGKGAYEWSSEPTSLLSVHPVVSGWSRVSGWVSG